MPESAKDLRGVFSFNGSLFWVFFFLSQFRAALEVLSSNFLLSSQHGFCFLLEFHPRRTT